MERCERDRVAKICLSCVGHVYANRWFHRRAFKNLKAVTVPGYALRRVMFPYLQQSVQEGISKWQGVVLVMCTHFPISQFQPIDYCVSRQAGLSGPCHIC